jgi:hypothetical protein
MEESGKLHIPNDLPLGKEDTSIKKKQDMSVSSS